MARWLFLVLLVLNLLLFVWGYQRPQTQEEILVPLPDGAPTILLLSELDAQKSGNELESPTAEVAEASAPALEASTETPDGSNLAQLSAVARSGEVNDVEIGDTYGEFDAASLPFIDERAIQGDIERKCVRLGPIKQRTAAADLISELSRLGHDSSLDVETEQRENGYWVLIPPGSEDPDFVVANLELAGIDDTWRFTKGNLDGAVSLGLYSDREQAGDRLLELAENGFDAEVRPRTVETSIYWVRSLSPKGGDEATLEPIYDKYPWLGYPPLECVEIATP